MFFFYIFHYIIRAILGDRWTDIQKNCLNGVLGTICYFLLYGYLTEYATGMFGRLKEWFLYLIVIDIIVMGVIYRTYYGRSIVHEIGEDLSDRWDYDQEKHRYSLNDYEKGKEAFKGKMENLDKAEDTLRDIEERKADFEEAVERFDELEQNVQELDAAIRYAPGGDIAKAAEADFNQRMAENINTGDNN